MNDIKEGDIFRWKFKNHLEYLAKHQGSGTAYWCLDQQCFATERSGEIYLVDTYWTDYGQEYLGNTAHYVDPDECDLEFVCNLNDVQFINKWETEDYDLVYNLSRQKRCYQKFAVDKGAQVSNKALKKKYINEYSKVLYEKESAERRLSWLDGELSRLESVENAEHEQ